MKIIDNPIGEKYIFSMFHMKYKQWELASNELEQ